MISHVTNMSPFHINYMNTYTCTGLMYMHIHYRHRDGFPPGGWD